MVDDNTCYQMAKEELFPHDDLGDLTIMQLSQIIQRAQQIKRATRGDYAESHI